MNAAQIRALQTQAIENQKKAEEERQRRHDKAVPLVGEAFLLLISQQPCYSGVIKWSAIEQLDHFNDLIYSKSIRALVNYAQNAGIQCTWEISGNYQIHWDSNPQPKVNSNPQAKVNSNPQPKVSPIPKKRFSLRFHKSRAT